MTEGLSPANRALIERSPLWGRVLTRGLQPAWINALLNAARAEGPAPPLAPGQEVREAMSKSERLRYDAGRPDWRDDQWEDHCGDPACETCHSDIPHSWARRSALAAPPEGEAGEGFQARVYPLVLACFGPEITADKLERDDRFLEEALELMQSGDYPKERALALVDFVYGRPKGDRAQEVGNVLFALAANCTVYGLDMMAEGEADIARVMHPGNLERIMVRRSTKPTGSALPGAVDDPAPPRA